MAYHCSNPWTTAFVWSNGDVTHCCYSNIGPLGNINRQSFKEIWWGKRADYVRREMAKGNFIAAGCEQFCRVYRWSQLYGDGTSPCGKKEQTYPDIPEGLGRIPDFNIPIEVTAPKILGFSMNWLCNFKCSHCQSGRGQAGLSAQQVEGLWDYAEKADILRFVGGEFTVNKESLEHISNVSKLADQPTVFMNTNGHVGISKYSQKIENLHSFHLKFSMEGISQTYERIRIGGRWGIFENNLLEARDYFQQKNQQGKDWRLYMNFCVMASNVKHVPEVVEYACQHNIRLCINPVNGMRHTDENISMYEHLRMPAEELEEIKQQAYTIMDRHQYFFADEAKLHLDYVFKVFNAPQKLSLPNSFIQLIHKKITGQNADRFFYSLYKLKFNKISLILYLFRKAKKRFLAKFVHANLEVKQL